MPIARGLALCWARIFSLNPLRAQDVDFKGKTVTVIIPSAPGGGTDSVGRMIGRFLHDYLPGKPAVIFSNIPGGAGIKALNYFTQQVKPDGLTVYSGSSSNIEPNVMRNPAVQYDPKKLMMIGGFPAPTSVMILRKDAVGRLTDKSQAAGHQGRRHGRPHHRSDGGMGAEFPGLERAMGAGLSGHPGADHRAAAGRDRSDDHLRRHACSIS